MMKRPSSQLTRRDLLVRTAATAAAAGFTIVPASVFGQTAPSVSFGAALIGCGSRGNGTFGGLSDRNKSYTVRQLAKCDVKWKKSADNKSIYSDFRRVLDRKDIDLIAIATPPHWHALISILAMEAGKDVLCEKPMTRTIAEGRAVVNAAKRYKRIFQIGTYGRFGMSSKPENVLIRKIMTSGLLKDCKGVYLRRGGFKVKEWSGRVDLAPQPIPEELDWDMYCGPSPLRPYHVHRTGMTHRGYWDYEGGGLCDMGQHYTDPLTWLFGKDHTAPVEIEASGPPQHPLASGMWAWVKLKYADGFTLVFESGEWGQLTGMQSRSVRPEDLSPEDLEKVKATPDPEPLLTFSQAVMSRKQAGGHAEAAHRTVCILHLANIAIRMGRKIHFDPVKEEIVGDPEANALVNQPMRAPWHL